MLDEVFHLLRNFLEHFSGFHSLWNLKALLKMYAYFQGAYIFPHCVSSIWNEFLFLISPKYIHHTSCKFCLFYWKFGSLWGCPSISLIFPFVFFHSYLPYPSSYSPALRYPGTPKFFSPYYADQFMFEQLYQPWKTTAKHIRARGKMMFLPILNIILILI